METNSLAQQIDAEIAAAKTLAVRRLAGEQIQDFDIRGKLYGLAMQVAPNARNDDLATMKRWMNLKGNESIVDLAAGTGFFTKEFLSWTSGRVIAVDPAQQALDVNRNLSGDQAQYIIGSPDDVAVMSEIKAESIQVVSSFGGLHHVLDQRAMMEQITRILEKGGRFVASDVGASTPLAHHFDIDVTQKSLTGHYAIWLSKERLLKLIEGLPLRLVRAEIEPLQWKFNTYEEMGLFFKGLHAYELKNEEIVHDLKESLGYEMKNGKVFLNWAMLFFEIKKQ